MKRTLYILDDDGTVLDRRDVTGLHDAHVLRIERDMLAVCGEDCVVRDSANDGSGEE